MTPLILATAVSMCPSYQTGDTYPFMLLRDCPTPVAGLLYPLDHVSVDRERTNALTNCAAVAESCADTIDKMPEPPSRVLWASIGAVAAVLIIGSIEAYRD